MNAVDSYSIIYPLYNDMYIRDNLSDFVQVSSTGGASRSPDIIPASPMLTTDPQETYGASRWFTDLGKKIQANQFNYIYVRAMNLAMGAGRGNIYLYYCKASLLLWSDESKDDAITMETGADNRGVIAVTDTSFHWNPASPRATITA